MLEKLNELIGKEYHYKGNDIKIEKVKKVNGTFVVFTNKRTYNFFQNEVDMFLSELKNVSIQVKKDELNPNKMEENEKKIVPIQENNLTNILLDTIERIQQDKDYVPQANAICNVITQMINVKKLEIQLKK